MKETLGVMRELVWAIGENAKATEKLKERVKALENSESLHTVTSNAATSTNLLEWINNLEKRVFELEKEGLLDPRDAEL